MTLPLLTILLTTIHISLPQPSPFGFNNQFIYNSNASKITTKSPICDNFWCVNDANMLFTQSSQYKNVDPCVDFRNFTLSNTIEISQVNDRYIYRGLLVDTERKQLERNRKVLSAKVTGSDNRIVKVVKGTYQKCLKSQHTFRHLEAHRDAIEYLEELGGSPYLSKHKSFNPNRFDAAVDYKVDKFPVNLDSWNQSSFNLMDLFLKEPHHAMAVLLNLYVGRCNEDDLCMRISNEWTFVDLPNFFYEVLKDLLEGLEDYFQLSPQHKEFLMNNVFLPAASNVDTFMKTRVEIEQEFESESAKMVKIKELKGIGGIDWLEVINQQLLNVSKVTEDDEILLKPNKFRMLAENMQAFDKSIIADTFVLTFLYSIRHTIILRFFNIQDTFEGRKKNLVRSERCIYTLEYYVQPAMEVIYEKERAKLDYNRGDFNRHTAGRVDVIKSAKELAAEALADIKQRLIGTNFNLSVSADLLQKFKETKIIVGFTNDTLAMEDLEEFYEELNLDGSEGLFKAIIEMRRNSWKIFNEKKRSWRNGIEKLSGHFHIEGDLVDGNYLFIPPLWIIYPLYHPLRPRFFNMATFYQSVFYGLTKAMIRYTREKFNFDPCDCDYNFEDNYQVAYESYSKWLTSNKDLELGANFLTNKQLFWMALAMSKYNKYHRNVPKDYFPLARLQIEYMHVWLKRKPGFQDAFGCELTDDEKFKEEEYLRKYQEIYLDRGGNVE